MDRREAMLRELNLYPLWVQRHAPELTPSVEAAVAQEPPAALPSPDVQHDAGNASVSGDAAPRLEAEVEDLFVAEPHGDSSEDSLREFQLKIAGGPLADVAWTELGLKVRDCELCALCAGCTQTVFGVGDEQADWLFVGEAPGEDEDASGEPFVGQAGRLLDNMLRAISIKRGDNVYIANVIKCRPEQDRHPHVGEIAACLPYLKRQIALIQPKLIVALGKTAASALLDTDATIATLRGSVHDYNGTPLIVTYHPAYLLRSPMEKAKAWQDLRLAVATLQKK
ncbi:MAG: uracil-DNA glycosylase [Gallionella sp.]|nr:uracil-DNA glycosylase [Gallionella sp.]MDP1939223.1 uracil-DNA glycosylase [Gallionella sp.]